MSDKKALIVLAPAAKLQQPGTNLEKFLKKGALFTQYAGGDPGEAEALDKAVPRLRPEEVAAAVESGTALAIIELPPGDREIDKALGTILDGIDRRSVVAVAAGDSLAFYGTGVNSKAGALSRACHARDIIPTLAYIADFPIAAGCVGAILYQALKSPNLKLEEIGKLREALVRMEGVLARDNREPWDKHDCA